MRSWLLLGLAGCVVTDGGDGDTDVAETDETDAPETDETDADETDETDDTNETDETDDTDTDVVFGTCGEIPDEAYAPSIDWSVVGYYGALVADRGAQGAQVIADAAALDAFLALVGSPEVEVDLESSTVVAVWYQASSTCGVSLDDVFAWSWAAPHQDIVVRVEDLSYQCCVTCDALGGVAALVVFPSASSVDVCVEVFGGCEDDTDACE